MADVEPFEVTPVRIELEGPGDGSDQRRADDAQVELPYDASEASRAATDVYDQSEGGALPLHRRLGHESVWWYGSEAQPCIAITTATDCTGRVPSRCVLGQTARYRKPPENSVRCVPWRT